jgi:hypothetical protein
MMNLTNHEYFTNNINKMNMIRMPDYADCIDESSLALQKSVHLNPKVSQPILMRYNRVILKSKGNPDVLLKAAVVFYRIDKEI